MEDAEVQRQILQMTQFIKQEAEEKASEIMVAAEEEFNIEKLQMVESEKQRIRREFERKEAQIESRKRIEHSTKVNQARLRVLRAREECIRAAIGAAHATLATITADQAKYSQLLVSLTAQAMTKVRCRRADLALVEAAAPKAAAQYARAAGCAPPSVVVNTEAFLPAAAAPGFEGESCAGGVVVASMDGKIVCANTLDERLAVAHDTNLPVIRKRLFGE
eukprot:PRCOL_00006241-RA